MSRRTPAFRRRTAAALSEHHVGPNMTPMVDVVMVILIFFMASAVMLGPEWFLRTTLPTTAPAPPGTPPSRVAILRLPASGDPTLIAPSDANPSQANPPQPVPPVSVAWADLLGQLRLLRDRHGAELALLIEPDPDTPYDTLVRAHELGARAGITSVGLAPPASTPAPAPAP